MQFRILAFGALAWARSAEASPRISLHVEAAAAHPAEAEKAQQFSWGGAATVTPELALGDALGLELCLGAVALAGQPDAPRPEGVQATEAGLAGFSTVGPRLRPLSPLAGDNPDQAFSADGLWLAGGVGAGLTGEFVRPAIRAAVGFDAMSQDFSAGPFVGYVQMIEPDAGSLRPDDARIAVFGLHGALFPATRSGQPGDPDADRDGVLLPKDGCPTLAEDRDGFEDADGCPENDNDGDTIFDIDDACDQAVEDLDGFEDYDGCPESDNDRDGLLDQSDLCPNEAEDIDGTSDEDGCPDADEDQDGVPDAVDRCPGEDETANGLLDGDGCPDEAGLRATQTHIITDEHLQFGSDSRVVTPASRELLQKVANFILGHPEYAVIQIQGHADDLGSEDYNLRLSTARALHVKTQLMELGVEERRLFVSAFGEHDPAVRAATDQGRAQNRRVEFQIKERAARVPRASRGSAP